MLAVRSRPTKRESLLPAPIVVKSRRNSPHSATYVTNASTWVLSVATSTPCQRGRRFYNGALTSASLHARNISPHRALQTPLRPSARPGSLGCCASCCGGSGIAAAGALSRRCASSRVALAVAYPNLPDISDLSDYRPKLPLRVFSSEGILIGEFGEERRNLTPIATIPKVMKDAVLAAEDARFYDHGGVDYKGMVRAGLANLNRVKSQGASTITMQVARNVYLSSEKTLTRKIYEVLLTFKLEHLLTKDQILEIYLNQIFLGNRAYGFAAASEAYFGKPLKDITIAEAAMLAGLPKAPGANNPVNNPDARARRASST